MADNQKTPHAQAEVTANLSSALNKNGHQRLIRRPEVEARTGLSRSTLYDWMKRGDFLQPSSWARVLWRGGKATPPPG